MEGRKFSVIGFLTHIDSKIKNGKQLPKKVIFGGNTYTLDKNGYDYTRRVLVFDGGKSVKLMDDIVDTLEFPNICDSTDFEITVPYENNTLDRQQRIALASLLNMCVDNPEDVSYVSIEKYFIKLYSEDTRAYYWGTIPVKSSIFQNFYSEAKYRPETLGLELDSATNSWEVVE